MSASPITDSIKFRINYQKSLHRSRIFRGVQTLSMIHLPWNWGRKISVTQAPKDTWIHITAGQ